MWINTQSCSVPVLIVGIVSFLAVSADPSHCLALDDLRLLQTGSEGGQFKLLHWSHPEAKHFIPGLSFTEKFKLAVQNSRERLDVLSSRRQLLEAELASAPASRPSGFVSPLFNLMFEYSMEIVIGTPPRKFSAIADTGSDLVWLQCKGCSFCVSQDDPLYDPTKSSTYKQMSCSDPLCLPPQDTCKLNTTCIYGYYYGSGLVFGDMSHETITLTSTAGTTTTKNNFAFGCDYVTILDTDSVDGLVGLGQGPQSFTTQLGSLYGDKFSYCLVSIYDSRTKASVILFGDAAVPTVPIRYTPMVKNPNATYFAAETFYYIGLKGIKVNGEAVDIPSGTFDIYPNGTGGMISDSGTALTYLTSAGYVPLLEAMKSSIPYTISPNTTDTFLDLCYDLSNVSRPEFPVITMVFDGFDLDLPSENVFVGGITLFGRDYDLNSTYCMTIAENLDPLSIFGNIQQQNFQILHDRKARVFGYAEVKCDRLS